MKFTDGCDPAQPEICPFRPERNGTEWPLQNRSVWFIVGFVEAARLLGGQIFVSC
jgi:hypothetical protein